MDRSQGNDVLNTGVTHDLPIFLFGFLKDARGARKLAAATGSLQAYISGSGPGGAGGQREGHTRPLVRNKHIKTRLTSPSHRFLPLRQAVQARAPLFGMWAWEDADCADAALPAVVCCPSRLWGLYEALPGSSEVRRRFVPVWWS